MMSSLSLKLNLYDKNLIIYNIVAVIRVNITLLNITSYISRDIYFATFAKNQWEEKKN